MFKKVTQMAAVVAVVAAAASAQAGVVFDLAPNSIQGRIFRWDAAPRMIGDNERSLDGGLRYSVSGGSLETFRNQFSWDAVPTMVSFSNAVQQAFDAWAAVDPVSGLRSNLSFVYDGTTAVQGQVGAGGANANGAEIDLIATTEASFWKLGGARTEGESWFRGIDSLVTLTSGVAAYEHSQAISGADIYLNSNVEAIYSLDFFRRMLTHEIGHALGLGDVESQINPARFIDDNFDPTSAATKVATLNNSWAALVNPLDPSGSLGLSRVFIGFGTTAEVGIDILMESFNLGISAANPVTNLVPLGNDDFGTRQFLYPFLERVNGVAEPSSLLLMGLALALMVSRPRRTR